MFDVFPERRTLFTKLGSKVMEHGTFLMHQLAHRYKAQRVQSDHTIAAHYGNAMGKEFAVILGRSTAEVPDATLPATEAGVS